MNKTGMMYFEKDDILHLAISDEPEAGGVEVTLVSQPNLTQKVI
jgi:hypothetical protein